MDSEATCYMLQLLLLDKTTRYLYFLRTTFPLPPAIPGDGDTKSPSPAVLTPRCRRRMVQNLPNQVFTHPFNFYFTFLVAGFTSCHCVHPSTAFFFLWSWIDARGEKNGGETSCMARAL